MSWDPSPKPADADAWVSRAVLTRRGTTPRAGVLAVRRSLTAVVREEWRHRLYAERDPTALLDSR